MKYVKGANYKSLGSSAIVAQSSRDWEEVIKWQ
jgi:hypothetical protein